MRQRAVGGDVVTSVGQSAPGGSSRERSAFSAIVVGSTTRGDDDAAVAARAPRLASGAQAESGRAIVLVEVGAENREVITSAGSSAPVSASVEGHAKST